jgi:hypothetical protein
MALETAMAATARTAVNGHQDAACLASCSAVNPSNPSETQRSIDAIGLAAALRPLRPHQERALEALGGSLAAGKRRPMLQRRLRASARP